MMDGRRPSQSATPDLKSPPPTLRPSYSSKLGDQKGRSSESSTSRQPPVAQKAWASSRNPITGRSQTPQGASNSPNRQSATSSLREGQKVHITLVNGSEFEGFYANHPTDPSTCYLKMAQQRKGPNSGDVANGSARRDPSLPFQRRDIADARALAGNPNKNEAKAANGSRSFRTDTAISNNRPGSERVLKPWVPDTNDETDGSLEKSSASGHWDQFAENERRFGIKTDYDETIYTTAIDKSHPQYHQRLAAADRKAREIERSAPTTAHVAEERVMDHVGGQDHRDEEEKYSGVRRQDFPPLSNREGNKYTPPARRAPMGHSTVKGVPVDPAIISSQLRPSQKQQQNQKPDEVKAGLTYSKAATASIPGAKTPTPPAQADSKPAQLKATALPNSKAAGSDKAGSLRASGASSRSIAPQAKDGAASSRVPPSGSTLAVEHAVLKDFKTFAIQERQNAEKARSTKAKADKEVRLTELKKFANSFRLSTPVPSDLITIIAKDPEKQKEIQAKALHNAETIAKQKTSPDVAAVAATLSKDKKTAKDAAASTTTTTTQSKQPATAAESSATSSNSTAGSSTTAAVAGTTSTTTAPTAADHRSTNNNNNSSSSRANNSSQHSGSSGPSSRHAGSRQSYNSQSHFSYRLDKPPHLSKQNQATGNLAYRIREQQKQQQQHHNSPQHSHVPSQQQHAAAVPPPLPVDTVRIPPTGPANNVVVDQQQQQQSYGRRFGGGAANTNSMPPPPHPHAPPHAHMPPPPPSAKLNPNSHEFRPSAFAVPFNPQGPSQSSSPRSSVNNVNVNVAAAAAAASAASAADPHHPPVPAAAAAPPPIPTPIPGQLIRRKTKAIDVKKCFILGHIQSIQPPQSRNWDENGSLRPSFDTLPTWRQLQDEAEKPDSTMHLTYKQFYERLPLSGNAMATPNPTHVMPQLAHQHQLPFHLQHNPHNPGLRHSSPHIPPMSVHHPGHHHPHPHQQQAQQQQQHAHHGHMSHAPFSSGTASAAGDDQRMVHSASAQSFTSPRMNQVPMSAYPPAMNSPAQMQYGQPVMQPYMNQPNAPPQMRSYSNNPQFMPQQPPHMGGPFMMQPQFMPGPNGMHQVQMYPGAAGHPQFMPPAGGGPPQPLPAGSSGYPSPGRPAAPMMVHQGSHQGGQPPMYGMSPGVQYQQTASYNNQPPQKFSGQRPQ